VKEPRPPTFGENRKGETNDFYVEFCAKNWRKTPLAGQTTDIHSLDGQIQDDCSPPGICGVKELF